MSDDTSSLPSNSAVIGLKEPRQSVASRALEQCAHNLSSPILSSRSRVPDSFPNIPSSPPVIGSSKNVEPLPSGDEDEEEFEEEVEVEIEDTDEDEDEAMEQLEPEDAEAFFKSDAFKVAKTEASQLHQAAFTFTGQPSRNAPLTLDLPSSPPDQSVPPPKADQSKRTEIAQGLFRDMTINAYFLVDSTMESPCRDQKTYSDEQRANLMCEFQNLVFSTHPIVLASLIRGNLIADRIDDSTLDHALRKLWQDPQDRPGIYYQSLVDKNGHSPTPLQQIIPTIRQYIQTGPGWNVSWVHKIDNWINQFLPQTIAATHTKGAGGYRRYLTKDYAKNPAFSQRRLESLKDFLDELEDRLESLSEELQTKPLAALLLNIGWTENFEKRLKDHRTHSSSNNIMNLFEAVAGVIFGRKYSIQQVIIFRCWQKQQAEAAEVFFSRISQGYIDNGGGFGYQPAGINNQSANKISDAQWHKFRVEQGRNKAFWATMQYHRDQFVYLTESVQQHQDLRYIADIILKPRIETARKSTKSKVLQQELERGKEAIETTEADTKALVSATDYAEKVMSFLDQWPTSPLDDDAD